MNAAATSTGAARTSASSSEAVGRTRKLKLGVLHQARARLKIADEDYRDRLEREFGVRSASKLDMRQLDHAIDMFHVKRESSLQPHARLVRALWIALANLGAVDRTDAALDAFVARQTGKQSLRFVTSTEANSVTEALKDMCAREGFAVAGDPKADRVALVKAQWAKMHTLQLSSGDLDALYNYVSRKYLTFRGALTHLSLDQLDDCAKAFGFKIRNARLRKQQAA